MFLSLSIGLFPFLCVRWIGKPPALLLECRGLLLWGLRGFVEFADHGKVLHELVWRYVDALTPAAHKGGCDEGCIEGVLRCGVFRHGDERPVVVVDPRGDHGDGVLPELVLRHCATPKASLFLLDTGVSGQYRRNTRF